MKPHANAETITKFIAAYSAETSGLTHYPYTLTSTHNLRQTDTNQCDAPAIYVSQCRNQAKWVYYGVVFEVKKEIPDGLLVLFYTRDVEPV